MRLERGALLRFIATGSQQLKREQMARVKTGIDALERQEAAEHQARTDEQHERQRYFRDHHAVTQQPRAA